MLRSKLDVIGNTRSVKVPGTCLLPTSLPQTKKKSRGGGQNSADACNYRLVPPLITGVTTSAVTAAGRSPRARGNQTSRKTKGVENYRLLTQPILPPLGSLIRRGLR